MEDVTEAQLLRTDITENLDCGSRDEKELMIQSSKLGKSNTGYMVTDFTDKKEGIIFKSRRITHPTRQQLYNKEKEMLRPSNKELRSFLYKNKEAMRLLPNILRVEQNITTFEGLRRAFEIKEKGEIILGDVLNSEAKPLLKEHESIMKFANEVCIFDEFDDLKVALLEFGRRGLLAFCNEDFDLVLDFVKHCFPKKPYKKRGGIEMIRSGSYIREVKKLKE